MENPQAQMPQGQPGPAPEQMQQGAPQEAPQGQPQEGGQDPQMQQIMQLVQQMMQQGVQPVEAAAELLSKQVPPEIVMQVFVQLGMPEQDAQAAIQQAMEGGQQQQGQGEEQMEGQASNPQEEMAEQGAPAPDQGGQPSPAEEIQMKYGGRMPRRLRSYAEGGDNQEMQAVMQQVQDMMSQGSDARQVMEQIQAAVQQGQISPEVGTSVMEQLSGMQQATDPQGSDVAMTDGSQDPQALDPNVAAPEAQMLKFGGNLKKLMSRAYGGPAVAPGTDSKTYAKDRTSMFVGAVKNSAYKSTLDDEFPSLGGNQMSYGGGIPKAANGIEMKDGKVTINPKAFKSEAEYKAAVYDWNNNPANKDQTVTNEMFTANKWSQQPDKNASYKYDEATGTYIAQPAQEKTNQFQFAEGDIMGQDAQGSYITRKDGTMQRIPSMQNQGAQSAYSQINPVAYQNPMNQGLYGNLFAGASPFARMMSGVGSNNMYDPRITGANLPGGMSGEQFLGAAGANGLVPGMAGKVGEQNWRVGEAEKFKEGSIFKGNRRKGVRYQIDWGDATAMNPGEATSTPPAGTTIQTDVNGNQISVAPKDWRNAGTQVPGTVSFNKPAAGTIATTLPNPNLIRPASTDVINPSSEVNQVDQNANTGTDNTSIATVDNSIDVTKQTETGVKGIQDGNLVTSDYKGDGRNKYDRQSDRQVSREENQADRAVNRQENQDARQVNREQNKIDRPINRQERRDDRQDKRQDRRDARQEWQYEYGGGVDPAALENAIALINRAFGGNIPKAVNGIDLGSEDADANKIPDYLQAENLPANQPNQPNPFDKNGTIEQSAGKKLDINWNQVGSAAGDMYMNAASKVTNFANNMNAMNPERDMAKMSALNRPSNTYDTMKQGLYDQAGNFIPNDIGNQVLNPTDTYYNNQQQIFSYGGKVYAIGGEVDLEDDEMEQLAAAGFKLSRV